MILFFLFQYLTLLSLMWRGLNFLNHSAVIYPCYENYHLELNLVDLVWSKDFILSVIPFCSCFFWLKHGLEIPWMIKLIVQDMELRVYSIYTEKQRIGMQITSNSTSVFATGRLFFPPRPHCLRCDRVERRSIIFCPPPHVTNN